MRQLIDFEDFEKRAWQEITPQPLSSDDVQRRLVKSSYNTYRLTIE